MVSEPEEVPRTKFASCQKLEQRRTQHPQRLILSFIRVGNLKAISKSIAFCSSPPRHHNTYIQPVSRNIMTGNSNEDLLDECWDGTDQKSIKSEEESTESEDADSRRVDDGAADDKTQGMDKHSRDDTKKPRLMKRMSQRLEVLRRQSSIVDALPETPAGWAVFASILSSLCLGYEMKLQKSLTVPPTVYSQLSTPQMKNIYSQLTAKPESILRRTIQPSLFVGTRGVVASTAAYMLSGPHKQNYIHFREIVTMPQDGAKIALDWELPPSQYPQVVKKAALRGPLTKHVVLILHGINNDASFGYIRSFMRACTLRGWAAVGFNFRGQGGVDMATPYGYNGSYTGDIRSVVHILSGRLDPGSKLFIVGNSLGANLITKYLGEEGRGGTLPKCVAGGISLSNPLHIHSGHIKFPYNYLLGLGVRKAVLEQWRNVRQMTSPFYQARIKKALMASTIGKFDEAMAPIAFHNNTFPPYEPKIGYEDAEAYWKDASSYRYIRHVSVPLLQLSSEDDMLVASSSSQTMNYSLSNPNVMVVNTKCGGHLGWHECPPDNKFGIGTSWADTAATDFIEAVLKDGANSSNGSSVDRNQLRQSAEKEAAHLQSRL